MRQELDDLGVDRLEFRDPFYTRYVLGKKDKVTERMGLNISPPSSTADLHDQLTPPKPWLLLEFLPRLVKRSRWPDQRGLFGYYLPLGQYRYIPPEASIHPSAFERRDALSDYDPLNIRDFKQMETGAEKAS
jgi:hypothetical protein